MYFVYVSQCFFSLRDSSQHSLKFADVRWENRSRFDSNSGADLSNWENAENQTGATSADLPLVWRFWVLMALMNNSCLLSWLLHEYTWIPALCLSLHPNPPPCACFSWETIPTADPSSLFELCHAACHDRPYLNQQPFPLPAFQPFQPPLGGVAITVTPSCSFSLF